MGLDRKTSALPVQIQPDYLSIVDHRAAAFDLRVYLGRQSCVYPR